MRRRTLIFSLGAIGAAWPLLARAQRQKVPKIGVLVVANPEPFASLFRQELRGLGYIEGQSIQIEFRSADGKPTLLPGLAAELVRLKVDLIVANQTPAVQAAKQATSEIPIIMAPAADPVAAGLVASLSRPGGNVTGLSFVTPELQGKNLELIREMLPATRRVMFLGNALDAMKGSFFDNFQRAGRTLGIETPSVLVRGADEFDAAFAAIDKASVDALMVQPSLPRKGVIDRALKRRLPAYSSNRAFAVEGGLMSYAGSLAEVYQKAALYVDKILRGARPANLPVEQPTKFELVINMKTAKALGIKIPQTILLRADEVIE